MVNNVFISDFHSKGVTYVIRRQRGIVSILRRIEYKNTGKMFTLKLTNVCNVIEMIDASFLALQYINTCIYVVLLSSARTYLYSSTEHKF